MSQLQTAAIILIGNELLSGKIRDENAAWLAGRLRTLGVDLRRVVTIPDDPMDIIAELRACADRFTHVFTSGGIGPTHDDITLETVAAAWDVPVVLEPRLEGLLRAHFGARLTADHLRMAALPAGTRLIEGGSFRWPVLCFRNVYILPGIPEIFREKVEVLSNELQGVAFHLRNVYLNSDEGEIAEVLRSLEPRFGVQVGSYPRLDRADHRVRITVEARAPEPVDAAVDALLAALPPAAVVRVDARLSLAIPDAGV